MPQLEVRETPAISSTSFYQLQACDTLDLELELEVHFKQLQSPSDHLRISNIDPPIQKSRSYSRKNATLESYGFQNQASFSQAYSYHRLFFKYRILCWLLISSHLLPQAIEELSLKLSQV